MSQKEIKESLELLEKDWDVDPILHDFVLGKYTDVTDFSLIVKNVVFHIPYLPRTKSCKIGSTSQSFSSNSKDSLISF